MVRGAAIYVSSLRRCAWTEDPPYYDPSKALRWSTNFVYKNNSLIMGFKAMNGSKYDIATDTKGFLLDSSNDNSPVKVWT